MDYSPSHPTDLENDSPLDDGEIKENNDAAQKVADTSVSKSSLDMFASDATDTPVIANESMIVKESLSKAAPRVSTNSEHNTAASAKLTVGSASASSNAKDCSSSNGPRARKRSGYDERQKDLCTDKKRSRHSQDVPDLTEAARDQRSRSRSRDRNSRSFRRRSRDRRSRSRDKRSRSRERRRSRSRDKHQEHDGWRRDHARQHSRRHRDASFEHGREKASHAHPVDGGNGRSAREPARHGLFGNKMDKLDEMARNAAAAAANSGGSSSSSGSRPTMLDSLMKLGAPKQQELHQQKPKSALTMPVCPSVPPNMSRFLPAGPPKASATGGAAAQPITATASALNDTDLLRTVTLEQNTKVAMLQRQLQYLEQQKQLLCTGQTKPVVVAPPLGTAFPASVVDSKLVKAAQQLISIAQQPTGKLEAKQAAHHIMNLAAHAKQPPGNAQQAAQQILNLAAQPSASGQLSADAAAAAANAAAANCSTASAAAAAAAAALGLRPTSTPTPARAVATPAAPRLLVPLPAPPPPPPAGPPGGAPTTNLLQSIMNQVGLTRPPAPAQPPSKTGTAVAAASDGSAAAGFNKLINSTASNLLAALQTKQAQPVPAAPPLVPPPQRKSVSPLVAKKKSSSTSKRKTSAGGSVHDDEEASFYVPEDKLSLMDLESCDKMELRKRSDFASKKEWLERIAAEVKIFLRPLYEGRKISKHEYKDLLRTAVSKIASSKPSEIKSEKVGRFITSCYKKNKAKRTQDVAASSD